MAGETIITVVGNLTSDPELRYTQNGLAVANFTIASTPRTFDRQANDWKDGEALFLRASVWREFAEHVAGSLTKGSRVIATGRLKQRSYETKSRGERYLLIRRLELQAQCFEGIFLAVTARSIGLSSNDRYQLRVWHAFTGDEDPPTSRKPDHGSSTAQIRWLNRGLNSADFGRCNTWTAKKKSVK